jgi:AAA family ATP:ADP antiporter
MTKPRRRRDQLLSTLSDTRHGEAETAILLTVNVFLLLLAYYLLKVAREPLILAGGGAEVKSYSSAGQAVLLIFATYAYGALASRVDRVKLIGFVTLFFVVNLLVFSALGARDVAIGVPFYLWLGIFNMMAVAQFWAFAADIYDEERGKRLFPILGIGSASGAFAGSLIGRQAEAFPPPLLMLIAAGILVVCVALTVIVDRLEKRHAEERITTLKAAAEAEPPPMTSASGWKLLVADRYLVFIAALMLAINLVNTTGEYILDRTLLEAGGADQERIQTFKADLFMWVNGVGLFLQTFVVARVIKYLGVRVALFVMPLVSMASYGTLAVAPILGFIFVAKVAENSLDYSLQNTARHALWLVVTREAKYKVKQVVDTFFVRMGDVASAGLVAAGTFIGLGTRGFAVANAALVAAWLAVLTLLVREHRKRAKEGKKG